MIRRRIEPPPAKAMHAVEQMREPTLLEKAGHWVSDHPTTAIAAALGLGVLIGAYPPTSNALARSVRYLGKML